MKRKNCLYCGKSTKSSGGYYKKFCDRNCQISHNLIEFNKTHEAIKCECCGSEIFDKNGKKVIKRKRFCNKSCKMKAINPMNNGNVFEHWIRKYGLEEAKKKEQNRAKIQAKKAREKLKGIPIKTHFENKYGKEEAKKRYDDYIKNQIDKQKVSQTKRWKTKEGKLRRKELSKKMSGKNNPMYGKPTPKGSGNGWSGWYNGFYFRSLKELKFILICERLRIKICDGEKKEFRISYTDWKKSQRTSIPDFIIEEKYIIEIKPKHLQKTIDNKAKFDAFRELAKRKGMIFKVIDTGRLSLDKFMEIYKENKIQLIDRYEEKLNAYISKNKS